MRFALLAIAGLTASDAALGREFRVDTVESGDPMAPVRPGERTEPSTAPTSLLQNPARPHSHTHDGTDDAAASPITLELVYTAEGIANIAGGVSRGARYLDNLDLVIGADLDALVGWSGASLGIYGLYNNGASISDLAGDAQAISNIETGVRAARLYELWLDQKIGRSASLRAGLYDLNSEFDVLDASGLFVSSPHGIGTDFAQSGRNGPSIFPSTSLAARLSIEPAQGWIVRAAILDGVPNDPARPGRMLIRLSGKDGALAVAEVQAPLSNGGKLLLGHWHYTARFDRIAGGTARGNGGSYVRAEMPIVHRPEGIIDVFARAGTASGRFNMFDFFRQRRRKVHWLDTWPRRRRVRHCFGRCVHSRAISVVDGCRARGDRDRGNLSRETFAMARSAAQPPLRPPPISGSYHCRRVGNWNADRSWLRRTPLNPFCKEGDPLRNVVKQ